MSDPGKVHGEIGKGTGYAVATVIGLVVVAFVASWALGFWSDTTVERRGQTDQQEQTQGDGHYRIAQYDAFFDRCQAIVAKTGQINDLRAAMSSDPTQRFYDEQNLRALQSSRRELVAQYNADAAKTATAGQFRDSNLPAQISAEGTTTCTA